MRLWPAPVIGAQRTATTKPPPDGARRTCSTPSVAVAGIRIASEPWNAPPFVAMRKRTLPSTIQAYMRTAPLAPTVGRWISPVVVVFTVNGPAAIEQSGRATAPRITAVVVNATHDTAMFEFDSGVAPTTSVLLSIAIIA